MTADDRLVLRGTSVFRIGDYETFRVKTDGKPLDEFTGIDDIVEVQTKDGSAIGSVFMYHGKTIGLRLCS